MPNLFLVFMFFFVFSSILLIGDSNIRNLRNDIQVDPLLRQHQIDVLAFGGMRSNELGPNVSLTARQYNHVVVAVGSNDLTEYRDIKAKSPFEIMFNLVSFARCVARYETEVFVVGVWKRRDVESNLVEETNKLLFDQLQQKFVPPKLKNKHFNSIDTCHLNRNGRLEVLALLNRTISNRF